MAASSVSPVRMRIAPSTGRTNILPSPTLPVAAAERNKFACALSLVSHHEDFDFEALEHISFYSGGCPGL